jgi:ketosteroid isomerase-like protein
MLTIEQRLQHLEDEAAIRDLAARFADAATRADYETIRSLFTPDAVFTIGEPFAVTCKGIDQIVAHIRKLRDGKDFFVEFVHSGLIQLDGNTAQRAGSYER